MVVIKKTRATKKIKIQIKEHIIKIHISQEESEDSNSPSDNDIKHDEVQSPWKIGVH